MEEEILVQTVTRPWQEEVLLHTIASPTPVVANDPEIAPPVAHVASAESSEIQISDPNQWLPGYSEHTIEITVSRDGEFHVPQTEIKPGVFTSEALITVRNGRAYLTALNTTVETVCLKPEDVALHPENLTADFFIVNHDSPAQIDPHPGDFGRIERVGEVIDLAHCEEPEKALADSLIHDYPDLFHLEGDLLTHTDVVQHEIDLRPNTAPIFVRQYRIPEGSREEVNRQIDELEANGIIEPSTSEWNFPLLLVKKKDNAQGEKQFRLVVDFRKLNEVTANRTFPIPLIDELLESLGKSKWFSTLDIQSAFHQIVVRPSDRELLSFQTNYRKMQFVKMPFGLVNSPRTWQRAINTILADLLGDHILVYLDDILIHTSTLEEHDFKLRQIFGRLLTHNVKLKPEKAHLYTRQVAYLGHVIDADGVRSDPKKCESIRTFPIPRNMTEVQSFLGLAKDCTPIVPTLPKECQIWLDDRLRRGFQFTEKRIDVKPRTCTRGLLASDDSDLRWQRLRHRGHLGPNRSPD